MAQDLHFVARTSSVDWNSVITIGNVSIWEFQVDAFPQSPLDSLKSMSSGWKELLQFHTLDSQVPNVAEIQIKPTELVTKGKESISGISIAGNFGVVKLHIDPRTVVNLLDISNRISSLFPSSGESECGEGHLLLDFDIVRLDLLYDVEMRGTLASFYYLKKKINKYIFLQHN